MVRYGASLAGEAICRAFRFELHHVGRVCPERRAFNRRPWSPADVAVRSAGSYLYWHGEAGRLLVQILGGRADTNVGFEALCALLRRLGFTERTRGSHHVFQRAGVEELINLQRDGEKAKVYQVRQVRTVLLRYGLTTLEGDDT